MNIEYDKIYTVVLKNGYVCTVNDRKTKITLNGKEYGITFHYNGIVMSWIADLPGNHTDYDIVEILPTPVPPLPVGYNWLGGWPTLKNLSDIKKGDFYLTNYPEYAAGFAASTYSGDFKARRIILEKIGVSSPDLPKENLEEYVDITHMFPDMHARVGIDESGYGHAIMGWSIESEHHKLSPSASMTIGEWYKERQIRHRCKRKHLPVATPVKANIEKKYPIYYLLNPESKTCAKFILKTSENTSQCIRHDGKPYIGSGKWGYAEDGAVRNGMYKLSSQEEYDKWLASLTVEQYPIYYKITAPSFSSKFVVKTSIDSCYLIRDTGPTTPTTHWGTGDDECVKDGRYVLSSKEEAEQFVTSLKSVDPKYYIHKDRNIGFGWIAYAEVTGNTEVVNWHNFAGSIDKRTEGQNFAKRYADWQEVSKEEAEKFYLSVWPKPIYYRNNGAGPNYIIRTSATGCSIVINNGKIIPGKTWIGSKDYETVTESTVTGFIAACEEFESLAALVVKESPKASKIKRAANYFVVEPTINMARAAIKSLRYILLVSVVGGGVYAYSHPENAKKLLPKINIKFGNSEASKS